MKFFTVEEFETQYPELKDILNENSTWKIEAASEMIFSQIGLRYRNTSWDETSVPSLIKNASMEQLRFMLEHDIPYVDINQNIKAGNMEADLKSDYSTLALRMLSNGGYLFRGSPMNSNMSLTIPFGE